MGAWNRLREILETCRSRPGNVFGRLGIALKQSWGRLRVVLGSSWGGLGASSGCLEKSLIFFHLYELVRVGNHGTLENMILEIVWGTKAPWDFLSEHIELQSTPGNKKDVIMKKYSIEIKSQPKNLISKYFFLCVILLLPDSTLISGKGLNTILGTLDFTLLPQPPPPHSSTELRRRAFQ